MYARRPHRSWVCSETRAPDTRARRAVRSALARYVRCPHTQAVGLFRAARSRDASSPPRPRVFARRVVGASGGADLRRDRAAARRARGAVDAAAGLPLEELELLLLGDEAEHARRRVRAEEVDAARALALARARLGERAERPQRHEVVPDAARTRSPIRTGGVSDARRRDDGGARLVSSRRRFIAGRVNGTFACWAGGRRKTKDTTTLVRTEKRKRSSSVASCLEWRRVV